MKFLKHITKKTRRILAIGILVNLCLIFFASAVFYMLILKSNSVETLQAEIFTKEEETKKLMAVKRLIEDTQEDLSVLDSYFTNGNEVVEFIEEIENIGKESGLALSLRSVSVEKENGNTLSIYLSVSGSWRNVYHFLNLLELFPANIRIDKVSLAKKDRGGDSNWTGDFSLSLISFSEK